jgi:hypothetical protein
MDKHPADELNEDLVADRAYGERSWNPLEQNPVAAHNLERRGQRMPTEIPWLEERRKPFSSARGAVTGFGWTAFGIGAGAVIGFQFAGIAGLLLGGVGGAWLVARFSSR